ncbi:PalH-domain-containing protein [Corynespora cassiicola Philippines]|uniref:PalH-domain-containing protein n=1 Tax=Corynespora cassiicola Philippines TaxID=1448308 RepID=A0A2T2NLS2_CORCC|nr:PalH-domain-containing protein [Corynespora cassiicola Philippines]
MEGPEGWKRAQLFGGHPTTTESFRHCQPFKLLTGGTVEISPGNIIVLETDATFTPKCYSPERSQLGEESGGVTSIADTRDPFHASITPQAYATGAATVIAWMLVIMLIITPRTFFVGGASPRSGLLGRRGMISGASGGGSIIGVGTRPWLQKVAALTVAVSLTLATADTFRIAEGQYKEGFMDAMQLRNEVVSGTEIKVSRVISDIFLWLAQVQTLIRLFPRHKEKVIIKWVGFALILLDIVFSCLNSFGPYNDKPSPRHFETAIPALSYLFQLSLSMLYAAWVMYYAVTKRRYAFYHSMMWNMSIVALLSIVAILTPVVFFITDISNYTIAGWGDYFRWVGAAAASVIVWEWVERIEALEREERKDGILGREIYDGDEMLDSTPSHEINWPRSHRQSYLNDDLKKPKDGGNGGGAGGGGGIFTSGITGHGFANLAHRLGRSRREPSTEARKKRTIHIPAPQPAHRRSESAHRGDRTSRAYLPLQSPPPVIATPVSRTDTTSADSTVYTVRYHPISESPPTIQQPVPLEERLRRVFSHEGANNTPGQTANAENVDPEKGIEVTSDAALSQSRGKWNWQTVANPFRRKGRSPPPEVQRGRVIEPLVVEDVSANIPPRNYTGLALKDRLGTFAAHQGEKFRNKKNVGQQLEVNLPVTIIPAQPRGRTWSPENLAQQDEVSDTAGIQIGREVTPALAAVAEDGTHDSQSDEPETSNNSSDTVQDSTGNISNRASRIRFTPETFQRPNTRQQPDADGISSPQPPTSGILGAEVQEHAASSTPALSEGQATSTLTDRPQTPTNHDR